MEPVFTILTDNDKASDLSGSWLLFVSRIDVMALLQFNLDGLFHATGIGQQFFTGIVGHEDINDFLESVF